jgi:hypothetical protein
MSRGPDGAIDAAPVPAELVDIEFVDLELPDVAPGAAGVLEAAGALAAGVWAVEEEVAGSAASAGSVSAARPSVSARADGEIGRVMEYLRCETWPSNQERAESVPPVDPTRRDVDRSVE